MQDTGMNATAAAKFLALIALCAVACASPVPSPGVSAWADLPLADLNAADVASADLGADALGTSTDVAIADSFGADVNQSNEITEDTPDSAADVAASSAFRDWTAHPAIAVRSMAKDLWFLGDVHGDAQRLDTLLTAAGLINPAGQGAAVWTAGAAVLVCTGDLIDKGSNSLGVIKRLQQMQAGALAQGGEVVVTLGNHEAEFLADPMAVKVAEFADELTASALPPGDVAQGLLAPGDWLRNCPLAAKVGPWFACHAGNTAGLTLPQLQYAIEQSANAGGFAHTFFAADDSMLESRLNPPLWFELPGKDPQTVLQAYVQALGAAYVVQGHQPGDVTFADGTKRKAGKIYQQNGILFLVDAGMSSGVDDSKGALLHITAKGQGYHADTVDHKGKVTPFWDSP